MENSVVHRHISLAVLPLQVLTADPAVEMFCQGLVMDLITDLSWFRPFHTLGTSEHEAGTLLAKIPEKQGPIRQLASCPYTLCERKGEAQEAGQYNMLVGSWYGIVEQSHEIGHAGMQTDMFNA